MFKKTKEKINNNQYVILFKKLWDNKRYRSILILGLYFIFFWVVISATRTNYQNMEKYNEENNNQEVVTIVEKMASWNNYKDDFNYNILVNDELIGQISIVGGIINLDVDDNSYIIINNTIYKNKNDDLKKVDKIDDLEISIPILKLNIENIMTYIKDIEDYSYEEDRIKYQIPITYFIDIEEELDEKILVEVIGNDNLEKIIIHNDLEIITLEIKES